MHVKQAYPYRKHKWTPRETYYQKYRYKALCEFFSAQVKYSYHGCFVLYLFSARWNIILTHRKKINVGRTPQIGILWLLLQGSVLL